MKYKVALIVSGMFMLVAGCDSPRPKQQTIQMNNETCPVTGKPVNDRDTYVHKGKEYKLCGEKCKRALLEHPEKYLGD